jgi:Flp pilus assembly protein TadD
MDRIARPGRVVLGLGCLFTAATVGCQSVTRPKLAGEPKPASQPAPTPARPDQSTLAKTDFQRTITKGQQFGLHMDLGKAREAEGNYPAAAAEFQKALEIGSHTSGLLAGAPAHSNQKAEAHRRLAGAYDHLGKFPQAEEHYKAAVKLAASDPKVWNDSGYSYYMQGRFDQAERCLRNASKLDPDNPRVTTNLGLALAAAGKSSDALDVLSRVGGPAVGHANLAYLLASLGRTDEARVHYHKAIELQPQMTVVKDALAKLDLPARPAPPIATAGRMPAGRTPTGISMDTSIRRASAPAPRAIPPRSIPPRTTTIPQPASAVRTPTQRTAVRVNDDLLTR